jgi:phage gp45-like
VHQADKGEDGQIEGSAEGFVSYMGGNRALPVIGVMDDRRHRLKELDEGDTAFYRGKDDRQQMHMTKDGNFMSSRNDRKQRFALVDPPKDESQQQAQGGGGSPSSGGASGGKKEKKKATGQKAAKDDNLKSEVAIEQNGKETFSQHGKSFSSVRGGSDASNYYDNRKKSSQATEDHVHMRYEDFRIWVDKEGHWSEMPILQKKDGHCKE